MADENNVNKLPKAPPPLPGGKPLARPQAPMGMPTAPRPPSAGGAFPKPPMKPAARPGNAPAPSMDKASSDEVEEVRRQLETQMMDLQKQLQEEREKALLQTVRVKEEEALASKVEESLKDIQDRLRREKREQELQENLSKSENQIRELEQRITAERQTWVETLKNQMGQKESQDKEIEYTFELRLKELEKRWHEEKMNWAQALKNKEEELVRVKRETEQAMERVNADFEKKTSYLESERESLKRELKDVVEVRQDEKNNLLAKIDAREKEFLSLKAQQAMLITQIKQGKDKLEQMNQLFERVRAEKISLTQTMDNKEKEYFLMKTQFALYQTRAKSEQEKLLKEMVMFKESAQKDSQQYAMNFKIKEEELNTIKRSTELRQMELKQEIDKKETEYSSAIKMYDDKLRARENEAINFSARKDEELRAATERWSEVVRSKDKEISESAQKEREMYVSLTKAESRVHELEERSKSHIQEISSLKEAMAKKESEFSHASAQKDEDLRREKQSALEKYQLKEQELNRVFSELQDKNIRLAKSEDMLQELEGKIASMGNETVLFKETSAKRENELKEQYSKNEQQYINDISALEEKASLKDAQAVEISQKYNQVLVEIAKKDEHLKDLEEKSRLMAQRLSHEHDNMVKKESEFQQMLSQKEYEFKKEHDKLQESLSMKEENIKTYQNRERDMQVIAAKEQEKAHELENKLTQIEQSFSREKENNIVLVQENKAKEAELNRRLEVYAQKEREMNVIVAQSEQKVKSFEAKEKEVWFAIEKADKEKKDLLGQIEEQRKEMKDMFTSKDEQMKLLRQDNEEKLRMSEALKKDLESEVKLLEKEVEYGKKEVERVKAERTEKDRAFLDDFKQKEDLYKKELGSLQEKTFELKRNIEKQKEEFREKLDQSVQTLKTKELDMHMENRALSREVSALKDSKVVLETRMEVIANENKQVSEIKTQNDKLQYAVSSAQLDRQKIEAELARITDEYRRAKTEKEELAKGMTDQIDNLRKTMRTELEEVVEKNEAEKVHLKNSLDENIFKAERLQKLCTELENRINFGARTNVAENTRLKEETAFRAGEEKGIWEVEKKDILNAFTSAEKDNETFKEKYLNLESKASETEKKLMDNMQEVIRLKGIVDEFRTKYSATAQASQPSNNVLDKTVVIAPKAYIPAEKQNGLTAALSGIWKSLNEPVIEINKDR